MDAVAKHLYFTQGQNHDSVNLVFRRPPRDRYRQKV
jgi:hypothetical protein